MTQGTAAENKDSNKTNTDKEVPTEKGATDKEPKDETVILDLTEPAITALELSPEPVISNQYKK